MLWRVCVGEVSLVHSENPGQVFSKLIWMRVMLMIPVRIVQRVVPIDSNLFKSRNSSIHRSIDHFVCGEFPDGGQNESTLKVCIVHVCHGIPCEEQVNSENVAADRALGMSMRLLGRSVGTLMSSKLCGVEKPKPSATAAWNFGTYSLDNHLCLTRRFDFFLHGTSAKLQ